MSEQTSAEAAAAAFLAQTLGAAAPKPAEPSPNETQGASPADDAARMMAELGLAAPVASDGGAAKKKKKKKKKATTASEETTKKTEDAPMSAVAKKALERLEQQKQLQLAQAEAEAEAKRIEEEEREKERLEAIALEKKKEQKRQAAARKKAEARAAGKAVTKAEKAREARAALAREKLIAQGLINPDEVGGLKPVRPLPGKRKSKAKGAQKKAPVQEAPKEPVKEEVVENEDGSEEENEEEVDRKEEEAKAIAEAARLAAEKVAEDLPSWDASDNEDWEAVAEKVDAKFQAAFEENFEEEEEVVEEEVFTKGTGPTITNNANKKKKKKSSKRRGKGFRPSRDESSDEDSDSDDFSDDGQGDGKMTAKERMRQKRLEKEMEIDEAREKREKRLRDALAKRSKDDLRSPICCVMGHVDTGKTKILDKIRRTNVQEGEAGGITQQIGATYFPMENLKKSTDKLNANLNLEFKVPGLLVIDTPGHESFSNLRKRGSSLCDIAILVIDMMHGLEQQTIESINMLRARKTPFIVALNKVDRLYGWKPTEGGPIRESLKNQDDNVISEFESRAKHVQTQLMEQGLNAALYYDNKDYKKVVSLVPTSAHTGEGIPDLLLLLVQLTQRMMIDRLMFSEIAEATVLDVKKIEGVGTTIDVVLVNGQLKVGDTIVVAGMNGAIVTTIRALLTPGEMREMRVKGEFVHHETLRAAVGIKIAGQDLEDAIAGTQMMVLTADDNEDELCEAVMSDVQDVMENISTTGRGVCVQASTLGSLEALLEFLRVSEIPVASVNIGPIHKRDVSRASIMLEHQKEYAVILAFDVKVSREAQEAADDMGVRIFTAEIIYHLFDQFTKYINETREVRKAELEGLAVFPCILKIISEEVFRKKNPLIMGVTVAKGICKVGTPLVVPDRLIPDDDNPGQSKMLSLGKIVGIQKEGVDVDIAKAGSDVCIKIQGNASQARIAFGRHFDESNELVSELSRSSIDLLKENFRNDLQKSDWALVISLKKVFNIA